MSSDSFEHWVQKAEHDYLSAGILFNGKEILYDVVCYHVQQCVEKYLKAFLVFKGHEIQKRIILVISLNYAARSIVPSIGCGTKKSAA